MIHVWIKLSHLFLFFNFGIHALPIIENVSLIYLKKKFFWKIFFRNLESGY